MFITLTNATPAHKGKSIAIKKDLIVTMHTSMVTREDGIEESVTYIYVPPHGTWEVQETLEEVMALIK